MIFVYTTCRTLEEAKRLARLAVEKRIAESADVWPVTSVTAEDGAAHERQEAALLLRTIELRVADVEAFMVGTNHVSVPCIAAIDIRRVNREYKELLAQHLG